MERREALRAIAVLSITPRWLLAQDSQKQSATPVLPAPVPWTLGLNPRTPLPHVGIEDAVAQPLPTFFSVQEMAVLTRLSDVFVPKTEAHPGSLDAGTPLFLDFLIGHSPTLRGAFYKTGLAWLDTEAKVRFRKSFSQITDDEAGQILKPWLRTWMTDNPPTEKHADFVNIAHADIRTATVNSKPWLDSLTERSRNDRAELYWSPIDPDIYAERPASIHTRPTQTLFAP